MELMCSECGKTFSQDEKIWRCSCGGLLDIIHEFRFDPEAVGNRDFSMWRYREAIPVSGSAAEVSFKEGFTPLLEIPFASKNILVKQDHLFPTGSYKDRGASVLISRAAELGIKKVVEDSSGNAGAAIAAYCAKAEIRCDIYVPSSTSGGKLIQIESYGANLYKIEGGRTAAASAALKAAENIFYASHSYNPYFFHGTKTFSYEICEQLGWKAPDTLILPVGNGTLFLGAYIGFKELKDLGITDKVPKLVGIQSATCAPVYEEYISRHLGGILKTGIKYTEYARNGNPASTIAEGIAITAPVRKKQILKAAEDTDGMFMTVDDDEIKKSLKKMHSSGYYIEPTSGAVTAGIERYAAAAGDDELIVSVFTGHGLKAVKETY